MKNLVLISILMLSFNTSLRGDFVIAQFGDSVGAHPFNRSQASLDFTGDITWIGDNTTYPAHTFARSGWTFNSMIQGASGLDGLQDHVVNPTYEAPDAVYILGGYNDVAQAANDSNMVANIANLRLMFDLIDLHWGSTILVANVTNFPADRGWAHKQSNVEMLNSLIENEVDLRENTYLVDNNSLITDDLVRSDGLHISDEGQQVIGSAFASQLSAVPEPNSILLLTGFALLFTSRRNRVCR